MEWNLYKICFRLKSPLHIGWKRTAFFQQTRSFVPAKNIWGALIAVLGREKENYKQIEELIESGLRFSYFYPTDDKSKISIFPWEDSDKFEWLYLNSYVSTPLDKKLAKRGYLHEVEYISPYTREGNAVFIIGYILERKNSNLDWREALDHIQIGGERSSGWGRVKVETIEESDTIFGIQVDLQNDLPQIIYDTDNKHLFAHVRVVKNDKCENDCQGPVEPVIGRDTSCKNNFGGNIKADLCWMPGCKYKKSNFKIEAQGLWVPVKK